MISKDKQKHLIWGAILSIIGLALPFNTIIALTLTAFIIGCVKEAVDKWGLFFQKRTGWDWYDVLATVIGGLLMGLLLHFTGWDNIIAESSTILDIFKGIFKIE